MPLRSILLGVSEQLGVNEPTEVGTMMWRSPDLPSRDSFIQTVKMLYAQVELPRFPAAAWADIELDRGLEKRRAGQPVDNPEKVAQFLWEEILRLAATG